MIIFRELMVQLGLLANFKCQLFQCDSITVPIEQSRGLLNQTDLTSRKIHETEMQTAEPVSTREAMERFVKITDSIYVNSDLK